jgi:hypothetical protein
MMEAGRGEAKKINDNSIVSENEGPLLGFPYKGEGLEFY